MNALTKSLVYHIWLASRRYTYALLAAWVIAAWGILLFSGYGFIGVFFGIAAIAAGGFTGGYPVVTGTEEFLMSLPPTRKQQFLARFYLGMVPWFVLALISLGMMQVNLPQRFWRLFFSSGFTEFYRPEDVSMMWPLSLTIPLVLYVSSFVFASLCQRGVQVFGSVLGASVLTAGVVGGGIYLDGFVGNPSVQGLISVGLSLVMAAAVFAVGLKSYPLKEAAEGGSAGVACGASTKTASLVAVGVIIAGVLLFLFVAVRA